MEISFFGASGTVTGSCTLIETDRARILVDAGMFQGRSTLQKRNTRVPRIRLREIDAVVLTHAHLDHCGRLPVFTQRGLACPIYATDATCDLARLILSDAAHIQTEDARRASRRSQRRGGNEIRPLFSFGDVFATTKLFRTVNYGATTTVADGIEATFHDAGHILGSASIELRVQDGATTHRLVFSGDLGYRPQPVIADPTELHSARLVVMESTYGDRNHKSPADSVAELREVIRRAAAGNGKILIPSFAVGRTQTLLYHLREFAESGDLGTIPVFLDSPMAIEATAIYNRHRNLYDLEATEIANNGDSAFAFDNLEVLNTADDSRSINRLEGPAIIIAGSGMCNGGRILHHMRHNLWRESTHVIFVGFQAQGTLGRSLVDGATSVRILGEPVRVRAQIHTIGGFSAHADQGQLLDWVANFESSNPRIVLNHGEDRARVPLEKLIRKRHDLQVTLAAEGPPLVL